MKVLAALVFGLAAWAVADDDPVTVLMRVRDRVMAHAQRIPNHLCTETVTRDWYVYAGGAAPKSCDALLGRRHIAGIGALIRLSATDRLRLDVALAESREMYSWPGAAKFDDREIDEFVPDGAIGTGPFAAALLEVFEMRDPKFVFEDDVTIKDRHLLEYSFTVPEERSHYKAKAGNQWVITGFTGTLLVDPVTADLVRLTVRTEELSAATNACEVDSSLEFGMVRLRGEDYLIPAITHQRFIGQDGSEAENIVTFSACHEFRADSTVQFGESLAAPADKPPVPPILPLKLPERLPVWVEMTSTIQTDQAAAGDRVEGRLAEPIRDSLKTLVPRGAAVEGRLVRVGTNYGDPDQVTLGLQWDTVEVNGVKRPFSIAPEPKITGPDPFQQGWVGERRYAVFQFPGEHVVVKGLPMSRWLTFEP
jgi:hypothetical protein